MSRTDTATLIQSMRILACDIQSDDGVANAAIAEAADRLEEYAATVAKLPVYADTGRAFVPGVDGAWAWDRNFGRAEHAQPHRYCSGWATISGETRFYSTAAACEEAEGKAARETEGGE